MNWEQFKQAEQKGCIFDAIENLEAAMTGIKEIEALVKAIELDSIDCEIKSIKYSLKSVAREVDLIISQLEDYLN